MTIHASFIADHVPGFISVKKTRPLIEFARSITPAELSCVSRTLPVVWLFSTDKRTRPANQTFKLPYHRRFTLIIVSRYCPVELAERFRVFADRAFAVQPAAELVLLFLGKNSDLFVDLAILVDSPVSLATTTRAVPLRNYQLFRFVGRGGRV